MFAGCYFLLALSKSSSSSSSSVNGVVCPVVGAESEITK